MRSVLAGGGSFTAAEVLHQHANTYIRVELNMIYHSNNRNAYNQVTQITHFNFNWGMLDVSSYLQPKQIYFRPLWNFRMTRQSVGHLTPINSRHSWKMLKALWTFVHNTKS